MSPWCADTFDAHKSNSVFQSLYGHSEDSGIVRHEAFAHAAAMLLSALAGLAAGCAVDADSAEGLFVPALAAMLVFVFIVIEPRDLYRAFSNVRFTAAELAANFLLAPALAAGLGLLFFPSDADMRIGLLMLLAMPCTDWFLVFTASAKGEVALSAAILPLNLVLQVVLIPIYVFTLVGSSADFDIPSMLWNSAPMLAIPAAIAVSLRLVAHRLDKVGSVVGWMSASSGLLQLASLCLAIVAMFAYASGDLLDNLDTFAVLLAPLLIFFVTAYFASEIAARAAGLGYDECTSLIFTAMARNPPLALAIVVSVFPDRPLILITLAIAPLVELPILSAVSGLRLRFRPQASLRPLP